MGLLRARERTKPSNPQPVRARWVRAVADEAERFAADGVMILKREPPGSSLGSITRITEIQ
jgi:hypothetical protein